MKEYIVTCKNFEDLQSLYDDMETPGGNLYIPDRAVELVQRRNISRNTHYMLTEAEANEISQDSRVLACELNPFDQGIEFDYHWTQTGDFEKTNSNDTGTLESDDKNWGLYRMIKGDSVSNWGTDGTTEISNRTISTTASGRNVDVIIADGHINPDHPEFSVNADGTGGSRVNQFNWFQYSSALGYTGSPATYTYSTSGFSPNTNHGTHVAGTACGNTQGWARDANIYNIAFQSALSGFGGSSWSQYMWDYVRYFHKNKPINTSTGRRNPTVMNNSWGSSYQTFSISISNGVNYRGTFTDMSSLSTNEKKTTLEANGHPVVSGTSMYRPPARNAAVDADLQDAINDGVIVIASAGNIYFNCEIPTGQDYNNYLRVGTTPYYFSRGSSPGSADNVICVGSIGNKVNEYKSDFSNWGSRVDIWAPGSDIISAVYDQGSANSESLGAYYPLVQDPRNNSYFLASISGTSMAGPQVAGIIACLAEQEPNLTQAEALQHLIENSLAEVNSLGLPEQSPYEGFGDSLNRYAFIPKKRPDSGMASPAQLHKNRNTTIGVKYPRVRYQTTS